MLGKRGTEQEKNVKKNPVTALFFVCFNSFIWSSL